MPTFVLTRSSTDSLPATGLAHDLAMADHIDIFEPAPDGEAPVQRSERYAWHPLGHLFVGPDPRSPEEIELAQRKESKRRESKSKSYVCQTPKFW